MFYFSFAIVVVKSVDIGGIFVVFIYLIVPAAVSVIFTDRWIYRILISWVVGLAGSVIGIIISYNMNLSNGPTIVCVLALIMITAGLIKKTIFKKTAAALN